MRDGLESAEYAQELTKLGSNLLQQKKPEAAEPILRESLAILQKKQPGTQDTFHTESLLGARVVGPPEVCRRRAALGRGISGDFRVGESPEPEEPRPTNLAAPRRCIERLVQEYDAWGKPDEAAKRRKELEEAKARFKRPS